MNEEKMQGWWPIAFVSKPVAMTLLVQDETLDDALRHARQCLKSWLFYQEKSYGLSVNFQEVKPGMFEDTHYSYAITAEELAVYLRDQEKYGLVTLDIGTADSSWRDIINLSAILDGHYELEQLPLDLDLLIDGQPSIGRDGLLGWCDVSTSDWSEIWQSAETTCDEPEIETKTFSDAQYAEYLGRRAAHELGSYEKVWAYFNEAPTGGGVTRNMVHETIAEKFLCAAQKELRVIEAERERDDEPER